MKCPKCGYLGFDSGDRCRNCGFEFSLSVASSPAAADLPMRAGDEPIRAYADLSLADLKDQRDASRPTSAAIHIDVDLDRAIRQRGENLSDLPLFGRGSDPEVAPLVGPQTEPRPPLAVRRATPPARPRVRTHRPPMSAPVLDSVLPPRHEPPLFAGLEPARPSVEPAGSIQRLTAAIIDGSILGSIDLAVLYFTLRLSRVTFGELDLLPPVPFAGFLLLLNGAYLVAFTAAGGQTIGKMATRIAIVSADEDRLGFRRALVRTAGQAVSVLTGGLGFLPALIGRERRALHDRLARTKVVQMKPS